MTTTTPTMMLLYNGMPDLGECGLKQHHTCQGAWSGSMLATTPRKTCIVMCGACVGAVTTTTTIKGGVGLLVEAECDTDADSMALRRAEFDGKLADSASLGRSGCGPKWRWC